MEVYILRLKFKQSVYVVDKGNIEAGQEIEMDNKVAKSFIEANYAEEVVVEKVEKPKAPARKKAAKDGE